MTSTCNNPGVEIAEEQLIGWQGETFKPKVRAEDTSFGLRTSNETAW
jgi:hypothetical protein